MSRMEQSSDQVLNNAKLIRDSIKAEAQGLSEISGQMTGHVQSIRSSLETQKTSLQDNADQIIDKLDVAHQKMADGAQGLSETSIQIEKSLSNLDEAIVNNTESLAVRAQAVQETLESLSQSLEKQNAQIEESSEGAAQSMGKLSVSIEQAAEISMPIFDTVLDKVDEARLSLMDTAQAFDDSSVSNLEKLQSMGVVFDDRMQNLMSTTEEATKMLDQSSDSLSRRVDDIDSATMVAVDKMRTIENAFKDQGDAIHITTDQALLKIQKAQSAMDQQCHDISSSIGHAIVQMNGAVDQFKGHSDNVAGISKTILGAFGEVEQKTASHMGKISDLSQKTSKDIAGLVHVVKGESKSLLDAAAGSLKGLKQTADSFTFKAQELDERVQTSLERVASYEGLFDEQAEKVMRISKLAADNMNSAIVSLSEEMGNIQKISTDSQDKIEQSRAGLNAETELLADISMKAAKLVGEAASNYGRQSSALFKATEEVEQKVTQMRDYDARAQRDSFIASARFVLESLHSLSIDLTRSMDQRDIPDSLWNAYQEGDIDVFTSRLAAMMDDMDMRLLKGKYMDDHEFRTYVNRFTRQYEDIYQQAVDNDHGELMAALFSTSHIGHLYTGLCSIAGRKTVYKKKVA